MRQLRIIWGALLMSIVIYGIIAMILTAEARLEPGSVADPMSNPIVLALGLAAIMSLAMSFVMPRIVLKQGQTPERMRTASIIQWALIETIAIYGLLGAMLAHDLRIFYAFGAVAVAAMLMAYPREIDQTPQRLM